MDKKVSLSILIKHSLLLSDEAKDRFLNSLNKISEDEVSKIGYLLALEKKKSLESNSEQKLNELLQSLVQNPK